MNAHPLISAYATRHGLAPSARPDGRVTMVIDDTYRVHLQPGRDGWPVSYTHLRAHET